MAICHIIQYALNLFLFQVQRYVQIQRDPSSNQVSVGKTDEGLGERSGSFKEDRTVKDIQVVPSDSKDDLFLGPETEPRSQQPSQQNVDDLLSETLAQEVSVVVMTEHSELPVETPDQDVTDDAASKESSSTPRDVSISPTLIAAVTPSPVVKVADSVAPVVTESDTQDVALVSSENPTTGGLPFVPPSFSEDTPSGGDQTVVNNKQNVQRVSRFIVGDANGLEGKETTDDVMTKVLDKRRTESGVVGEHIALAVDLEPVVQQTVPGGESTQSLTNIPSASVDTQSVRQVLQEEAKSRQSENAQVNQNTDTSEFTATQPTEVDLCEPQSLQAVTPKHSNQGLGSTNLPAESVKMQASVASQPTESFAIASNVMLDTLEPAGPPSGLNSLQPSIGGLSEAEKETLQQFQYQETSGSTTPAMSDQSDDEQKSQRDRTHLLEKFYDLKKEEEELKKEEEELKKAEEELKKRLSHVQRQLAEIDGLLNARRAPKGGDDSFHSVSTSQSQPIRLQPRAAELAAEPSHGSVSTSQSQATRTQPRALDLAAEPSHGLSTSQSQATRTQPHTVELAAEPSHESTSQSQVTRTQPRAVDLASEPSLGLVSTTQSQVARSQPRAVDLAAEPKKEHVHREQRTTGLEQKRTETFKGNTTVTRGTAGVPSVAPAPASAQSKVTATDKKQTLYQLKEQRSGDERKRADTRSTPRPAGSAPQSYTQTKSQGQNQTKPTQVQQKAAVATAGQPKQTQPPQQVQTQQQVQPHPVQQKQTPQVQQMHSHSKVVHQMSASNFVQQQQHHHPRTHAGSFLQQPVEWTEFTGDHRVMAQQSIGFVPASQSSQTLPSSQSIQTIHPKPVLKPAVQKSTLDEFDPLSQGNP